VKAIENAGVRVRAVEQDDAVFVHIDVRDAGGGWRTLLGNGIVAPTTHWQTDLTAHRPDPQIEWKTGGEDAELQSVEGAFDKAAVSDDGKALTLTGQAECHAVEMTLSLPEDGRVYVTVKDRITGGAPVHVGRLMTHFFLIPDGRAQLSMEPVEFAWMPNIHLTADGVCGDHFFRSPAVIACAGGAYAGLVPDLDVFAENCAAPHSLDLRTFGTGAIEAPRLSYGICPYETEGHVYTKHDPGHTVEVKGGKLDYAFSLFVGQAGREDVVCRKIASFLWDTYGHRFFEDVRPQVVPFEEYGRRYAYAHELPRSIRHATIDGVKCTGIHNGGRRGSNFHAWENDLVIGFGVRHYAEKWRDEGLREIAGGIFRLIQHSPRNEGAFPCIYNFDDGRYEGSLFWTARAADFLDGYDTGAMGVTAWWLMNWNDHFDLGAEAMDNVIAYARFLGTKQLPSGAIPTFFFKDLEPARPLAESATTAISGAVLARAATITGDAKLKRAALEAGRFIEEQVIPGLRFTDFETIYSCSSKPMNATDYWTGIRAHNNLSIGWACDQMLALYRLTGDDKWLRLGEHVLSILSFYQQVWNPAHRSGYLYGGFGVMNTDGEWNDGRQARFTSTYADYALATGNIEYLERAVAACRASFALMDTPENHENDINQCVLGKNLFIGPATAGGKAEPGMGYAGENIHHGGRDEHGSGWTGMNWSAGGGLTASAYLERLFGGVWIDGATKTATPIDGAKAEVVSWDGSAISLKITSALAGLRSPYKGEREIIVKFGGLPDGSYTVGVNGAAYGNRSASELSAGIAAGITA